MVDAVGQGRVRGQVGPVEGLLEAEQVEPVEGGQVVHVRPVGAVGVGLEGQDRGRARAPVSASKGSTSQPGADLDLHPGETLVGQSRHLGRPGSSAELGWPTTAPTRPTGPPPRAARRASDGPARRWTSATAISRAANGQGEWGAARRTSSRSEGRRQSPSVPGRQIAAGRARGRPRAWPTTRRRPRGHRWHRPVRRTHPSLRPEIPDATPEPHHHHRPAPVHALGVSPTGRANPQLDRATRSTASRVASPCAVPCHRPSPRAGRGPGAVGSRRSRSFATRPGPTVSAGSPSGLTPRSEVGPVGTWSSSTGTWVGR